MIPATYQVYPLNVRGGLLLSGERAVDWNTPEPPSEEERELYTKEIQLPAYEPSGELPEIDELVDKTKVRELLQNIENSQVPDEVKEFLRIGACRHYVFNYSRIADFYSNSDKETQELMEQSALVIIDLNSAIKNGFVELTEYILKIQNEEQ